MSSFLLTSWKEIAEKQDETKTSDAGNSDKFCGDVLSAKCDRPITMECCAEDYEWDESKKLFVFVGKVEPEPPPIPSFCPPVFYTDAITIVNYLDQHNIESLLEYLVTLVCLLEHDDPLEYIVDYCDKLLECREFTPMIKELDILFTPAHIEAIFRIFDKEQSLIFAHQKYKDAMELLGLKRFNQQPKGYKDDQIPRDVFIEEANAALDLMLKSFIG